jgi:phage terminase small subunit
MPQGRPWPKPPHGFDEPPPISWRKKKISGQEEPAEPELTNKAKPIEVEPENPSRTTCEPADADKIVPIIPPCPSYLKGVAAELWPIVVRKLVQEGDWDDYDAEPTAALFCTHLATLIAAIEHVSEHGAVTSAAVTGVPQHSPYVKVLREAAEAVSKYGDVLNLTPATPQFSAAQAASARA